MAVPFAFVLALGAAAQEAKPGKFYSNESLGFEIKQPLDWESIPPSPGEENMVLKFDPPISKYVELGKTGEPLFLHCWIVKFDSRKKEEAPAEGDKPRVRYSGGGAKDLAAWIKSGEAGPALKALGKPKEFEVNKIPATEYHFLNNKDENESFRVYAVNYKLEPGLEVAVVLNAPAEPKKWAKYEAGFEAIGRSLRRLKPTAEAAPAIDPSKLTLRDKKRIELQDAVKQAPDWKLYETPNYFIVSNNQDRFFIDELMGRLEAIRTVYEQDYPYERAQEFKKLGEELRTKDQAGKDKPGELDERALSELMFGKDDPREMSKCSVVRVCKDQAQYHSYGGPGGSAGYWSPGQKELVIYDDRAGGGRGDTWAVLNHEAFHQYIFYLYGNISPHSWYNEGTGDFYSGYEYKAKRFKLEKFQWRIGTIKDAIQQNQYVPLDVLVRMSQGEYYSGNAKYGSHIGIHYAEGWSFIYFLRTGKKNNAKGWNPKWDTILDTYFKELAMTGSTDKAVDAAFNGVDFAELEKSWLEYTK